MPISEKAPTLSAHEIQDFLSYVQKNNPKADLPLIEKALEFALSLHTDQKRGSGEPYIIHPIEVAKILSDLQLDSVTIVTGLLHDTVEDTITTLSEIEQRFGAEIAFLVDGLTKISKINFSTTEEKQAENFRKMVLAMAKDLRVILVKIADRLHNMRTLQHLSAEKQMRIAQETLDIYAPLANRLGLSAMKRELEDLSLRFTKPEVYYKLTAFVSKKKLLRDKYIQDVQEMIEKALKDHDFEGTKVSGRPKHFYSIHRKMETKNLTFDQVFDLTAFRVIVSSIERCYAVLGVIHSIWTPVPGRFKDYIAIPKANLYQSLHTTVIGPGGERIEIQIRTQEMHETAEKGIAAHWAYKESASVNPKDKERFAWLNRLIEWNRDLKDPAEFLETIKLDLFSEDVYVFTPQGKVLELPSGATPLDFAYAIHTDLGHHCIGAKVDDRIVPLKHKLKSGDTIEILSSPNQRPNKDWLKIARTSRAKSKIRSFIKAEEHERSVGTGELILDKELKGAGGKTVKALLKDGKLDKIAESFSQRGGQELLSAIGYGKVSARKVVGRLYPKLEPAPTAKESTSGLQKIFEEATKKNTTRTVVKVKGIEDLLVRFARCCNPVLGESVIGFITRGRGVSIHTRKCPKMLDSDPARLVDIEWDQTKKSERKVKIRVVCEDRAGLLADMGKAIQDEGVNIAQAQIGTTKDKKAVCVFAVVIENASQLRTILSKIEGIPGVMTAERIQKKQVD